MFFAGLAKAFGSGLEGVRAENAARAERQSQQENAILQHLSTSDDPEIASAAITGLLHQAQGKPLKGIRGFLGEVEGHPALPTIRQLIQAGRQVQHPSQSVPAEPQGPPQGQPGSMAMPEQAATEPGAPPLSVSAAESGPPGPANLAGFGQGPSDRRVTLPGPVTQEPRQLFRTAGQKAYDQERGQKQALVDVYQGASPTGRQAIRGTSTTGYRYETDDYGGVTTFHNGEVLDYAPAAGKTKTQPRPTAPQAKAQGRADQIAADEQSRGLPPRKPQEYLTQALAEQRNEDQRTLASKESLDAARLRSLNEAKPVTVQHEDGSSTIVYVTPPPRAGTATTPPPAATAQQGSTPVAPMRASIPAAPPVGQAGQAAAPASTPAATPPPAQGAAPAAPRGGRAAGTGASGGGGGLQTKPATVTPDQTVYYADQIIRDPANLKLITGDKALSASVRKELASRGVDLTNLDQASRTMAITASDILKLLPSVEAQARELDGLGLMGPTGGRWREFLAGTIGAGELAGGNAINAEKIGRFKTNAELLKTALMKAHTGARGSGQMLQEFENTLGAGWRDLPTFLGSLKGTKDWMQVYASRMPDPQTQPNRGGGPPAAGGGGGGPIYAWDPQGNRHVQTDPSAQLPAGWTTTPPR